MKITTKLLSLLLTVLLTQTASADYMCAELADTQSDIQSCNQEVQSLSSELMSLESEKRQLKGSLANPFQAAQNLRRCDNDVWDIVNKIDDIYDDRIPKVKKSITQAHNELKEVKQKVSKTIKSWECIVVQEKWAGDQTYMAEGSTIEQAINKLKRDYSAKYNRKDYKDFEHICLPNVG